ncbi:MAG: DUF6134 family protein [Kiloniellales bacterium]
MAIAAALLAGLVAPPGSTQDRPSESKLVSSLFFHILRSDRHIGTAHVEISWANGFLDVRSKTEVLIQLGDATAYDFFQQAHEVWRNGRLMSYEAKTNDNGVEKLVEFRGGARGPLLIANGKAQIVSRDIVPTSLWHETEIKRSQFFDAMLGLLHEVKVSDPLEATIKVRGKSMETSLYTITGDIQRKLWYLPNGTLVQQSLIAPDGSEVLYKLR